MKNPFDGIRAVLFDMDGTLVETNIDFFLMKREMIALAGRYGIPASDVAGLDILAVVDLVTDRIAESEGQGASDRVRQEAFDILERIEVGPCNLAELIPHAAEVLEGLRSVGIKVGIVTRNCRNCVRISGERTGIRSDVIVTRDDVRNTKPHPDHLLCALELLHARPAESMMVGDHWMDVQAGKAAGMRTVGFLRPDRPRDFFKVAPPDVVIEDLWELLCWIQRLNN